MKSEELDPQYVKMLTWRSTCVDKGDIICHRCSCSGVRVYGDTSTWRNGIGGQTITLDVCGLCWGSRVENRRWTNLRKLQLGK